MCVCLPLCSSLSVCLSLSLSVSSVCLSACLCVCLDLNTSHGVSMLETMRSASLCIKLAAACKTTSTINSSNSTNNKKNKNSSLNVRGVDCVDQMNGHCGTSEWIRMKKDSSEWIDASKECCSDEEGETDDDDDDDDDDIDGDAAGISYKELFRMATLGGATGMLITITARVRIGKPSGYITNHLSRLSLLPSVGR